MWGDTSPAVSPPPTAATTSRKEKADMPEFDAERRWPPPTPQQQAGGVTDRRGFLRLTGVAWLLGVVGGAGAALGAAGCSSSSSTGQPENAASGTKIHGYVPGPQPVSGGRYGGTVAVVWTDPPNSLDPAVGYNLTAWDVITALV